MTTLDVAHRAASAEMRRLQGCSLRHAIKVALQAIGVDPDAPSNCSSPSLNEETESE